MKQKVLCGADVLALRGFNFKGKCGLITNHTGVLRDLTPTIDLLKETCCLTALFAPEHGVRGDKQAGEDVSFYIDEKSGLPVYSLYGNDTSDAEKIISSLDTVIFDIQDVGARFYTYQYTMTDTMKLCSANNISFIVLDRPNPLGGLKAEGTILKTEFSSFIGRFPTPTRSALTIGEFALMMNKTQNINCDLTVIPMDGWTRDMYYDDTDLVFIPPSPNIPTVDTVFSYIGTCIFEGTNLSEGRGTTKPFETIGAPWLNSEKVIQEAGIQKGVVLRSCSFTPTFSEYKDRFCYGIQLHIINRKAFSPFETGIRLLDAIRKTHPQLEIKPFITKLLGTDDILRDNFSLDSFLHQEAEKTARWQETSKKWYLYN